VLISETIPVGVVVCGTVVVGVGVVEVETGEKK